MFLKTLLFMSASFMLWFGGLVWFIEEMPEGAANPPLQTDAIVVLTGGRKRIAAGLDLLSQGKANRLMISGVRFGASLKAVVQGSGYKGNLDPKKIDLDYQSTTTVENAQNVAAWAARRKIKSIRLVTANYHMRRALIEFNHYVKDVRITPHAINPLGSVQKSWFKDYKIIYLYLNEYNKYLGAFTLKKIQNGYKKDP